MVENIPYNLLILEDHSYAEFCEALAAMRFVINAWNSCGKLYKLQKIPGRHKMHPFTLLRKHRIKLRKDDETTQPVGGE